ncbi:putative polyketide synthase [Roridomyces roridus]|uniref:Polyketide synthase n=1 Tax=Roridomyces roridus TaxID=1738132 RepID=A0AAD7AYY2_9AGAR|nr:putative polyketide synthase [Roridomyces roridus]
MQVPFFAGHGSGATGTSDTFVQAVQDVSCSSTAATLLAACHQAFRTEISTLSAHELSLCGISLEDFKTPESLLDIPIRYRHNTVLSWGLLIAQAVRYLRFVEKKAEDASNASPFADVLGQTGGAGILGFSAGIVMASVVASSDSLGCFLANVVQAYRLVLWMGVRSQIYRATITRERCDEPWGVVIEDRIRAPLKRVYLTTIMDGKCVTVSGRPDLIAEFSGTLSAEYIVHKTSLDMLYHSPVHVDGVRQQFPDLEDLIVPVWNTETGEPLNWDVLVSKFSETHRDSSIRLINFGPGTGLPRTVERAFPAGHVVSVDETRGDGHGGGKQTPIAVVGMSVNAPGASNATQLWQLLQDGRNTISEIPEHRFKVSDYNAGKYPGRQMKAHTGNFLDNVDEFDNTFFKISPREAKSMDPQQRVLLQVAYEALEDSGYVPNATPTSNPDRFGCYIGAVSDDYVHNLRDEIDVYYSTGTLRSFLSGRVSFVMQLSGPSMVVDTACSSGNVALYQASRALMNGDCDAALVGGVNTITSPDIFLGLDRGHFLSPAGQCKPFDASADGYSRSEGCTVFIVKRLSDALAENDNILGVIRGIDVNQSGLASSITHPHAETQATLFRQVLANAGIEPNRVNVVEAHGTGTQAGDPNEVQSLRTVLAANRSKDNPLHLTSIKANVGHLEAASGGVGLVKLLLMLQHNTIPRQISLKNLNPLLTALDHDNVVIDTADAEWVSSHPGKPRVALLNNFGASGSNTALILEEHVKPATATTCVPSDMSFVFGLSAKTLPALEELRVKYLDWLRSPASAALSLGDIAYTMTARRQLYSYRLAVTASSHQALLDKLTTAAPVLVPPPADTPPSVVFVYSGNGGQYVGMGGRLYNESPLFRACIDECEAILVGAGFPGVRDDIILGSGDSGLGPLQEFAKYHSAIFAIEYGLTQMWTSWGVVPSAVVGHSLGEYAALVTAGVLKLKDALLIVAHRVRLMVQKCAINLSTMIAVNLGAEAIQDILRQSSDFTDLNIACYNSPVDCVVAGPLPQLMDFKEHLAAEVGCKSVMLPMPFGCHSPAMTPLLDDLTFFVKNAPLRPPTIPIISNVLGDVVLPGNASVFTPAYFSRHCAEPVQFDRGVRALMTRPEFSNIAAWIEIGPHTTCLPMLKSNPAVLATPGTLLLGSLRKKQLPYTTIASSLAQLYTSSLVLKWRAVFAHLPRPGCVSLPSYPFAKTKYWVPFREPATSSTSVAAARDLITEYPLLYSWAQYPSASNDFEARFESPIRNLAKWIVGHRVGEIPLCPASLYSELVLAGVDLSGRHLQTSRNGSHVVITHIEFDKALPYDENVELTVSTQISLGKDGGTFSLSSRLDLTGEKSISAHGEFEYRSVSETTAKFEQTLLDITERMGTVVSPSAEVEIISTEEAYEVIFPRVVQYAKPYHTIQTLTLAAHDMEGYATIQLPTDYERGKFVIHPVWLDTLGHVAGLIANKQGNVNDAFICTQIGLTEVFTELVDNEAPCLMYFKNVWLPGEKAIVGEVYAVQAAGEERRIIAHMQGIHFHRIRLSSFKKSLARITAVPVPAVAKPVVIAARSSSSVDATIVKLVSDACDLPVSAVNLNTDLASIGIDSMMSIEIFGGLRLAFPKAGLDVHFLGSCSTVADICREVSLKVGAAPSESKSANEPEPRPSPAADIESTILKLVCDACDLPAAAVNLNTELASIGIDSMMSIEIFGGLRLAFPQAGLDVHFLGSCSVVGDICREVSKACSALTVDVSFPSAPLNGSANDFVADISVSSEASYGRIAEALQLDTVPVHIQSPKVASGRLPVFLVHDGSGLINSYHHISSLDRAVWGIHNPRFINGRPWESVGDMAAAYAEYILGVTTGPVILGGWSFGGLAAYEIALQLANRGVGVRGIVLIDSPCPGDHNPLSDGLLDAILGLDERVAFSDLGVLVRRQFSMNAPMLQRYTPAWAPELAPPLVLLRSREGFRPQGVPDVPAWFSDRSNPKASVRGWQKLTSRPVKVLDIPGHHFTVFHPSNIPEVLCRLAEACEYIESLEV